MPDILMTVLNGANKRLKDMGDGTVAEVVYNANPNLTGDFGILYRSTSVGAGSIASLMSPATATVQTIKATAGRLIGIVIHNSAASLRSLKFYNAVSVNLGTTAAIFEIDIQAGSSLTFSFDGGIGFSTAISWAVTSGKGLSDTTSTGLALNDVSGLLVFA